MVCSCLICCKLTDHKHEFIWGSLFSFIAHCVCFVPVLYCFDYSDWFLIVKHNLHSSDKSHVVMMKHLFYILLDFTLKKAMAPHFSTIAWEIPWMEEPGRLQSLGSWRVGHDWASSLSLFTFMHWRRKWQLTPVFLPIESQGWGSLLGCRLWGRTESDTTDVT